MGIAEAQIGAPQISRAVSAVNVTFPMIVDGLSTDQFAQVSYGPGGTVLTASGVLDTLTPAATYPVISPSQAATLLNAGGACGACSITGTADGVATTSGSVTVNVDINQASIQLSTYLMTNGASWLLPTWVLSGPESGTGVPANATFTGDVLAIPSTYVQVVPTVRY
jgi:hypothetical protein